MVFMTVGNYNSLRGIGTPITDLPLGLNVEGASRLKKAAGEAYCQVKLLTGPASLAALGLRARGR